MDDPLGTDFIKSMLLEMGFWENTVTIALWMTDKMEEAAALCESIQNDWGEISPQEYYFSHLSSMGYPEEAIISAIEKPSLTEAIEFLTNPPEEAKAIPENPVQNQRQPRKNDLFNHARGLLQKESKKVIDFLSHITKEAERVRNDLSDGGKVEYFAERFINEGMTFEDAFRELTRKFNRRRRREDLNREVPPPPEELQPGNEEWKEDARYISGERIIANGNVINPSPQLEILNILERFSNQVGLSERDKQKLRKVAFQSYMKPESCIICLEEFVVNEQVCKLPCNHVFHQYCIMKWLNRSTKCALCLKNI